MSEHAWVLENIASYVAGGLDADEREQLARHVAGCPDCAQALQEMRAADGALGALFADVRPNPALEDRSIQALRQLRQRPDRLRFSLGVKLVLTAAATVLLAAVGAGVGLVLDGGGPGELRMAAGGLNARGHSPGFISGLRLPSQDGEGSTLKAPETWAEELRESSYDQLVGGKARPGAYVADGINSMGRGDPLTVTDVDPAGIESKTEINYNVDRKPDVSVPGQFKESPTQPAPPQTPAPTAGETAKKVEEPAAPLISGLFYFRPADARAESGRLSDDAGNLGDKESSNGPPQKKPAARDEPAKTKEARQPPPGEAPPAAVQRKVIRSGEIEFEVDSFDAAVAVVTRLVGATRGGYISTVNSDKLPNGKVCGSVVVRVPPEQLDALVLDLRKELGKAGELKGQRIGSQDITKQYTDLESRLKAARTMEERLLKIIREGKGEIKDLLQAEKELGVWRTKVEEIEGELRYYGNLVALSTLEVRLTEKEIRVAATVAESERVQAGIEVEDVEKAQREALDAVAEAKGRVTRSELKQQAAGQFNALLHFEVDPAAAGPLRDRLRQLGTMVRLEIDRTQHAEGGVLTPHDGKLRRGPTRFEIMLYNLANVQPRETQTLRVAAVDVPAAYRKLREVLTRVQARVKDAQLNEQDRQNVTAKLEVSLRRADEGALQAALAEAGEVLSRFITRLAEGENVTDARVLFKVDLLQASAVPPRETVTVAVEVSDVDAALTVLAARVKELQGRAVQTKVGQERNGRVTARVVVDVPLAAAAGLVEKVKSTGAVRFHRVATDPQAPEGKLAAARLDVTLSNADLLVPRDAGLAAQIRNGLSFSFRALSLSVGWLIVGVLFVLPWLLLLYVVFWLARRLWRGTSPPVQRGSGAA